MRNRKPLLNVTLNWLLAPTTTTLKSEHHRHVRFVIVPSGAEKSLASTLHPEEACGPAWFSMITYPLEAAAKAAQPAVQQSATHNLHAHVSPIQSGNRPRQTRQQATSAPHMMIVIFMHACTTPICPVNSEAMIQAKAPAYWAPAPQRTLHASPADQLQLRPKPWQLLERPSPSGMPSLKP